MTAHRVLPYPAAAVYELVADVSSYATFVPYCSESVVTEWTTYEAGSQTETTTGTTEAPVAGGKPGTRYPSRATLRVGFGAIETSYASTVVCHPGLGVVEALSGREARSALSPEQLRAAGHGNISRANTSVDTGSSRHDDDSLFLSLETCWTVRPMSSGRLESPVAPSPAASAAPGDQQQMRAVSEEWSDVSLRIRFRFASPLYAAVSAAAADSVAGVMIAAFERRASELLGKKGGRGI